MLLAFVLFPGGKYDESVCVRRNQLDANYVTNVEPSFRNLQPFLTDSHEAHFECWTTRETYCQTMNETRARCTRMSLYLRVNRKIDAFEQEFGHDHDNDPNDAFK